MSATLWWLSFCDADRPTGEQFLGGCIVSGTDIADAARMAWANGINPGGECQGIPIDGITARRVPPHRIGVLLNRQESEGLDAEMGVQ